MRRMHKGLQGAGCQRAWGVSGRRWLGLAVLLAVLGAATPGWGWLCLPDQGDTGWRHYAYVADTSGFTGTAGFVVSNAVDNAAFSELLLDNLSQGGGWANRGFESGNYTNYTLVDTSYGEVTATPVAAMSGRIYSPTQGENMSHQYALEIGVSTAQFQNGSLQAGTVGSILETPIALGPGDSFSFDWAFLGNDQSPWNDFALFYLKEQVQGTIVFIGGLAQIGVAPIPIPSSVLLVGTGLLGVLGLARRANRKD